MTKLPSFGAMEIEPRVREKTRKSLALFERAQNSLAGGVSSILRRNSRPYPLYFSSGQGSRITDVDGNSYLDYALAWGPLILGHADERITAAIREQADRGLTFGAQHELEIEVAELLTGIIPCAERITWANSGTEIVQVALRLARAATGKMKFLKFEGHYHGWDDSVLVSHHPSHDSIQAAQGRPIGVGEGQRPHEDVVVCQWNDASGVEAAFKNHMSEISAVICEPMLCNSGCIPPQEGFLEYLRDITQQCGALLIFDEVITGFRLDLGGAQAFYKVVPDLATFGKAVGGGVALSVLAGRQEFMNWIAEGKVIHAGTLNGNPLALAAARATLLVLSEDSEQLYKGLFEMGEKLRYGLQSLLRSAGYTVVTTGAGPVFQLSFMEQPARNYRDTLDADASMYSDFALGMLDEGVLLLPDGRWYLSAAHSTRDIELTLAAAHRVLARVSTHRNNE
jgi:glutamate-1-semialdehyde 2,1-aminomutase